MMEFDFFGPGCRLHHVGLAVSSISAVSSTIEAFSDPIQKVRVAFMTINGAPVELIEPLTENSPVSNNLKKGQKLVHMCFEVPDIQQAIKSAKPHGFVQIAKPVPATAFEDRNIVWLFHKVFGLFELVETGSP